MTAEESSSNQSQPGTAADSSTHGGGQQQQQRKELEAIYLVLDCIIDLGLGDRGLDARD